MQVRPPHPTSKGAHRRLARSSAGDRDELEALRRLVVGPEQKRLDQIEAASPDVIGNILPEAVSYAANKRPDALTTTLEKPVTAAIRDIARQEPTFFGEILAPAIGTAVRRAVADALSALMQRINQLFERGLSLQSLRCRIEAWRTGRPFAEIIVARTLVYRVEWTVLIDSRTSLVLHQASSPDVTQQAPDQTAAMLAAINSFVSDAMQPTSPGAALHAIEVGDLSLWIERDPSFTIAIAIRGAAPLELRDDLRTTLQLVRALHPDPEPQPDVAAFDDTHPRLVDLLKHQLRRPAKKRAQWVLAFLGAGGLLFAAFLLLRGVENERADARLRAAYRDTLSLAPGIVVNSVEHRDDQYVIRGLRDPRATPPTFIVAAAGLPPATFELAPYESRDPRLAGPMSIVDEVIRDLEAVEIPFEPGTSTVPASSEGLLRAAELVSRLRRAASAAEAHVCVEVLGDNDESGDSALNASLRAARASGVVEALQAEGIPGDMLAPRGGDPLRARSAERRVTFRASVRAPHSDGGCS